MRNLYRNQDVCACVFAHSVKWMHDLRESVLSNFDTPPATYLFRLYYFAIRKPAMKQNDHAAAAAATAEEDPAIARARQSFALPKEVVMKTLKNKADYAFVLEKLARNCKIGTQITCMCCSTYN